MSTIRFRELVKTAGTPAPKSLWTNPKTDREFMRAVNQNRVLTVVQESAKTDFGELGFHRHEHALYFVFPKPLPANQGRVIGIKYDLVEEREPDDTIPAGKLKRVSKPKRAKSASLEKREPPAKTFSVVFRRFAVVETNISVEAHSKAEAREKSIEMVKGQGFDLAKAKIKNQIRAVKKIL
jgi:hypothetical protein